MKMRIEKKRNEVEVARTKESQHLKAEVRQIWNGKWETYFGLTIKTLNNVALVNEYYTFRCEAEALARWYLQWYEKWYLEWERDWYEYR